MIEVKWSDVAASEGITRVDRLAEKLGRGKQGLYSECQREHGSDDTFISDL